MKKKVYKLVLMAVTISTVLVLSACGNSDTGTASELVETVESTESSENTETSVPKTEPDSKEVENTERVKETEVTSDTGESIPKKTELETEDTVEESAENPVEEVSEESLKTGETAGYTYTDESKTMYAKSSVNVRNLPSTKGTKLGSLKRNNEVKVTGRCNETGWYRIAYGEGEAFVSDNYLSNEKVPETTSVTKNTNSGQTDFLTPDGFLNPNNPIVAAAYAKYGENIAIAEDGTVLDATTWQELGKIDNMPMLNGDSETGSYDRAAAEEVWGHMNDERVSAGLNALAWDENIYNFACQRARQIVDDFSHNGCGNYGENIEYQSGSTPNGLSIHMLWFLSPGHHENYMNANYGSGACAVFVYRGMTYAVENFALASNSNSQPAGGSNSEPANTEPANAETPDTEGELVGEIETGTTWTASNGVTLFIRSDGLISASMSGGHTAEECKAAMDEYYATH